jgi:predicted glutamine amidotransferase
MCRLYGFRATAPTRVECTLVYAQNALLTQSRADTSGVAHPDGWGIGYYENGRPQVERRETAAFTDLHFSLAAERVYSRTVVAHVRLATVGRSSIENTHPFVFGPWVFAHNGSVGGFERLERPLGLEVDEDLLRRRRGNTDSELAFWWLLSRMKRRGISLHEPSADLAALIEVVAGSVRDLADLCRAEGAETSTRLNFLLTDGSVMLASRWNRSLHWVRRIGVHDCEICRIPHTRHETGSDYRAVVLASEPISQEPWQPVPDRSILAIDGEVRPTLVTI